MKVNITRRTAAKELPTALNQFSPLLQRIYHSRGINAPSDMATELTDLLPYHEMPDIEVAVARLQQALASQESILVVGDFDADGATSTTVAIKGLKMFGAKHIDYLVPNRFDFGYGLSPELVEFAAARERYDLIVTVDNGVSSVSGVAKANHLGIDVVVTDHHLAGDELPAAIALVNPNLPDSNFPSKNLAGVGVIFYLLIALRAKLRESGWFGQQNLPQPNLAVLLDIVALGTVADVVPLDKNNRLLVQQGLNRIRRSIACPGIQALLDISQRKNSRLVASDLGFAVGPRLNAAGRLEDMSLGIECLLANDYRKALKLATKLDALNQERRALEQDMLAVALQILNGLVVDEGTVRPGLCLYDPSWHQGVIGILSSRIKERVHRPVICFAKGDEHTIKGSARSIPGCHVRDVLAVIDNQHPGLIQKFGGHAMAAGLSIAVTDFELFADLCAKEVERQVPAEAFVNTIYTDGSLADEEMSLDVAYLLREAGPWGQAFPEPVFDDEFAVVRSKVVGGKHLQLTLARGNKHHRAIAFNHEAKGWVPGATHVHAAYKLDVNEFKGNKNIQLMVEHMQPLKVNV